jgi:hypothetical protein
MVYNESSHLPKSSTVQYCTLRTKSLFGFATARTGRDSLLLATLMFGDLTFRAQSIWRGAEQPLLSVVEPSRAVPRLHGEVVQNRTCVWTRALTMMASGVHFVTATRNRGQCAISICRPESAQVSWRLVLSLQVSQADFRPCVARQDGRGW